MRYASILAALALAVTVSACATAATQEEFTRADADAIRQSSVDLATAFNEKQLETVLGFYPENSIFMPPNDLMPPAALISSMASWHPSRPWPPL